MNIRVSVVIPAYNAADTLPATLAALCGQTVPPQDVEVIVVDDGSTDDTAHLASCHPVRLIRQENQGPAAARNAGAKAAKGEVLVFTDADCEPEPAFLAEILRPFADAGVTGVQGAYRTRQQGITPRFAQAEFEDRYAFASRFPCLDLVATYAAAFRRDVFLATGGFDEAFPVANNEDTEFSYRLHQAGHRLVFAPGAVVFHRHPPTLRRYLRIKFWRAYWRLAACRRHPAKAVRDCYTPGVVRLQTALGGLCGLGLAMAPFSPVGAAVAGAATAGILASSVPFAVFAGKRDPVVGLAAPGIVLLRSLAFAAGAVFALADGAWRAKACHEAENP